MKVWCLDVSYPSGCANGCPYQWITEKIFLTKEAAFNYFPNLNWYEDSEDTFSAEKDGTEYILFEKEVLE